MKATANPDLLKERRNATFNTDAVTHFLDGGREKTDRRRYLQNLALSDPIESVDKDINCMSSEETYDHSVRVGCAAELQARRLGLRKVAGDDVLSTSADAAFYVNFATRNDLHPFGLHFSMFLATVMGQGTEEQARKWLPDILGLKIIGSYAQTELGHGTHIRGLETTATFDPSTQEFVLNTPTLTATKFWPGSLGKTVNHAIVMAQLHSLGVCHGVHPFFVQLRSLEDHSSLPGITLGSIGPKFGFKSIDNGFLRFHNYRIPRENMLMKFAQVSADGTYSRKGVPQLAYMSMVLIRSLVVRLVGQSLAQAATIAVRYSAVRRQTAVGDGTEPQIIDYQTQQLKLFPCLAEAYAYMIAGKVMRNLFDTVSRSVGDGDASRLEELHALSACLKAASSDTCSASIETLRLSCGGHGYSAASNFNLLYANCTAVVTYEGENTVMYLQTARALVKYFNRGQKKDDSITLPPSCAYLSKSAAAPPLDGSHKGLTLADLVAAMQARAFWLVSTAAGELKERIGAGFSPEQAWNASSILLVKASKAHAEQFVAGCFFETLSLSNGPDGLADTAARAAVGRLAELFVVSAILRHSGDYLQGDILRGAHIGKLERYQRELLSLIRPDAVTLVDAFDFPDEVLRSALGRYDGDVYEALYRYAQDTPLNKTDVHPSYFKYIQPLQKALSKL